MSWGRKVIFSFREQGAKTPPWGGGAITNVSDLQSRSVLLCGSVNKSIFYQAN